MRNRPDPRSRGIYLPSAARSTARRRRRLVALAVLTVLVGALVAIVVALAARTDAHGARVLRYSISSPLVHRTLAQVAVIPPGAAPAGGRGLVVFLHGKGGDESSSLAGSMFAALARLGPRAPDIVFPYGGEDSYWHDRGDGAWGRYVLHEVIPRALASTHADPRRVAIAGLSMGGFGAYDLARLAPARFCAVGGDSAALWRSGGETAPGAFDSTEDFARHDVLAYARSAAAPYAGMRLWLDVGREDPFRSTDTLLASELRARGRAISFHVWPGGHEPAYWNRHWRSYLSFYASALAACGR